MISPWAIYSSFPFAERTWFCLYVSFVTLHASMLISIASVVVGCCASWFEGGFLSLLTMRVRNVDMIPVPGPISTRKYGSCFRIASYSFSRESRNRKES